MSQIIWLSIFLPSHLCVPFSLFTIMINYSSHCVNWNLEITLSLTPSLLIVNQSTRILNSIIEITPKYDRHLPSTLILGSWVSYSFLTSTAIAEAGIWFLSNQISFSSSAGVHTLFSVKVQILHIFSFLNHAVSIIRTQFCCSIKRAGTQLVNEWVWLCSIKLYSPSLLTPADWRKNLRGVILKTNWLTCLYCSPFPVEESLYAPWKDLVPNLFFHFLPPPHCIQLCWSFSCFWAFVHDVSAFLMWVFSALAVLPILLLKDSIPSCILALLY